MERTNRFIQVRVRVAATVVVIDHFFEGLQTPVVHVGRGPRHFAQSWDLEAALPGALIGELSIPPRDTRIVELLVGQVRTGVTVRTSALAAEHSESGAGLDR